MADKGHDSYKNMDYLRKKGYTPLIPQKKIKNRKKFNKVETEIYKKRIKISGGFLRLEHYHSWVKKYKRVSKLYEKNIENYQGFLFLALALLISRRSQKL